MDKQKIIEMVERHTSVDSARKELVNLKTLLSTTDCKISQYRLELDNLKRSIAEAEKELETQKQHALSEAEALLNRAIESYNLNIKCLQDNINFSKELIDERTQANNSEIALIRQKLEILESDTATRLEKLNKDLTKEENKISIFKNKRIIDDIKKSIEDEKEALENARNSASNEISENEKSLNSLRTRHSNSIENYNNMITAYNKEEKTNKEDFRQQAAIFRTLDSSTDISKLDYFDQDSLKALVVLVRKLAKIKARRDRMVALLKQSKTERTEIIERINLLDSKIESVLQERAELKDKIAETTENLERQAMETINTVMSAVDTAMSYESQEDESEVTDEAERTANQFNVESILEKGQKFTKSLFSSLADEIIEEYANQSQNGDQTAENIGNAMNEVFGFFRKRK